jgi:hypothetical protein
MNLNRTDPIRPVTNRKIHVHPQTADRAYEAIRRELGSSTMGNPRDISLVKARRHGSLALRQAPTLDVAVDDVHETRLRLPLLGIRKTKVGKNVAASPNKLNLIVVVLHNAPVLA